MSDASLHQPPPRKDVYKAFVASLSGTSLEWYDFAVYSAASALVLGQLFFPADDRYAATISAFATYAIGYLSRPVGGVVFGRLGDKLGRKTVLVYTLVLIGAATFAIGVLPTYGRIGLWAPVALVILRFLQGVGVGGEWGGAVLLSSEYGNPRRRGFWASAAQVGPPAGNLLANGVLALLTVSLSEEQFLAWGWRVAFLASLILIGFGLWIRLKLEDTPVFKAIEDAGDRSDTPVTDVVRTQTKPLIAAVLSRLGPDVFYALYTVFILTYGTQKLGLPRSEILGAVLIGSATQLISIPLAGWLSDLVHRRVLYAVGAIAAALWSFEIFAIADKGSFGLLALAMVVAGTCHSLMFAPQAAFVIEQFHPRLRYTGASLAYTIGGVFGGALAPLMFTVVAGPSISSFPVALYVVGAVCCTLVGLVMGKNPTVEHEESVVRNSQA
ncbi:MHS family MFS transporter [Corynebacterium uropygiale]|uniref:Putative proline/betaine transporter n=1 Tax=Corynebacterium uropygiale TaxID=1775911 RepID=A0A9X1QTX4_9CORY|nr:MFS transporter [Corynebacterium uropygiale]MCF4007708.1 MHS family MFS transporter [Corynebacterium uropygiale]